MLMIFTSGTHEPGMTRFGINFICLQNGDGSYKVHGVPLCCWLARTDIAQYKNIALAVALRAIPTSCT